MPYNPYWWLVVVGVRVSAISGEIHRNRDFTVDIGTYHGTAE